jgi:hypothetical protein
MSQAPKNILTGSLMVLHPANPAASDLNLIKLAEFMGIPVCGIEFAGGSLASLEDARALSGSALAVAISAGNLLRLLDNGALGRPEAWARLPGNLFVYGFTSDPSHGKLAAVLSGGAYRAVRPVDNKKAAYDISAADRSVCEELSGLKLWPVRAEDDAVFEKSAPDAVVHEYLQIDGGGLVAGLDRPGGCLMLAAVKDIIDVDAPFLRENRLIDWLSQLVPAVWFFRRIFGARCWRGLCKQACLVIDDPLLRKRHGFLRYSQLLGAMQESNFATSIAFIPWNYRRSDREIVEMFRQHPDRFTLSIHGCDHSKHEFGDKNRALCSAKASAAHNRMRIHRQLTGLKHDNVMVFPEGVFTVESCRVLLNAGYLAAVNSTPFAVDAAPDQLRVRDMLLPVTNVYGLPLLVRHYPGYIMEFALDLFLGKPALIVEHHGYFQRGYCDIQELAAQINRMTQPILWRGLETIAQTACLQRQAPDGATEVRFFTNEVVYQNLTAATQKVRFCRQWAGGAEPPGVTVNGAAAEAVLGAGAFTLEIDLPSQAVAVVNVAQRPAAADSAVRVGDFPYQTRVFFRRLLCEFRDNYVHPGKSLLQHYAS